MKAPCLQSPKDLATSKAPNNVSLHHCPLERQIASREVVNLCFSEKTGPMAVLVYSRVEICSRLEKIFLLGLSEQLQNSPGSWILPQSLHERPSSSVK